MAKPYTIRFGPWTPDLQDVGVEMPMQWSDTELPCADCLNVYWQDAAYRCLPGLQALGPSLGTPILDVFTWYDNTQGKEILFTTTANGLFILVDGTWSPVPVESQVSGSGFVIHLGLGLGTGLTTAISPLSETVSNNATTYSFGALSAIIGYGTGSYTWSFSGASGPGTWSIASGQGTPNAVPEITGAVPGSTSTVTCECLIVAGGLAYGVSSPLSYTCTASFTPVTNLYTTGTGTDTAPAGASQVTIEVWGGGAPGGAGDITSGNKGGGGGAAGYSRSLYSVSGGQTITYAVGASFNTSTVSSGSLSVTTMTANSGTQGSAGTSGGIGSGGSGGGASGGNQANTTGGSGVAGGAGGSAAAGVYANTPTASYGDGGAGSHNATINQGAGGLISFHYT